MVISDLAEVGKLEVIEADRKFFGDQLPDKWVDDAKTLPTAGGTDDHRAPENITDVDPAAMHFFSVVEQHGDVDRVRGIYAFDRLHKAFRFDVPFILTQSGPDDLGNIVHGKADH